MAQWRVAASAAVLYGCCPRGIEAAFRDATYGSKKVQLPKCFSDMLHKHPLCVLDLKKHPCVVEEVLCRDME